MDYLIIWERKNKFTNTEIPEYKETDSVHSEKSSFVCLYLSILVGIIHFLNIY